MSRPGDLVYYAGRRLFFEPNGKRCYLYLLKRHVGKPELAVFAPAAESVKKLTPGCEWELPVTKEPIRPLRRSEGSIRDEIARLEQQRITIASEHMPLAGPFQESKSEGDTSYDVDFDS